MYFLTCITPECKQNKIANIKRAADVPCNSTGRPSARILHCQLQNPNGIISYGDPVSRTIKSGPCRKGGSTRTYLNHYSKHPRQQAPQQAPQQSPQPSKQPVNTARHSPTPKQIPAQHTLKQFRQSALLADGLTFNRFAERCSGSGSESCSSGAPNGSIAGSTV